VKLKRSTALTVVSYK